MEIEKFIVQPNVPKHEPIDEMWATPIPESLKTKLQSLPKDAKLKVHESARKFLSYIADVYSSGSEGSV